MIVSRLEQMKGGWFVGAFTPTSYHTSACEVSVKHHPKGEKWDTHYHTRVTEINVLLSGRMVLQGRTLVEGDIFQLNPYEIADPIFLEDCRIVCVKIPGGQGNDKVICS